jgi:hypothetical protein
MMVDQSILDAFQSMWGTFPEPVMLIQKNRTVLAVNDLAKKIGIPTDIKCFSLNPEEGVSGHCKQCKANVALRSGEAVVERGPVNGAEVIGYWLPVKGLPDVYVHLGIGTAERLAKSVSQSELVNL